MTQGSHAKGEFQHFSVRELPKEIQDQMNLRSLAEGELLFQEGDPASAIYFLESGSIRLVNYTRSGKTVDHYFVEAGEFFAEVLMLMTTCTCTAIAETTSQVWVIPKPIWIEALQTHPNLAIAYAGELTYRLHRLKVILQLRGIRFARERVWSYLQIMANPETGVLHLDRSQKAIAQELDITPETLSRVLSQLTRDKIIHRNPQTITLL